MKQHHLITSVRAGQILFGAALVLALSLPASLPRAQALHEIMGGSLGRYAEDIFECGRQRKSNKPCDLSYRYYNIDQPDEIKKLYLQVLKITILI